MEKYIINEIETLLDGIEHNYKQIRYNAVALQVKIDIIRELLSGKKEEF